jgi:hypothetical protein
MSFGCFSKNPETTRQNTERRPKHVKTRRDQNNTSKHGEETKTTRQNTERRPKQHVKTRRDQNNTSKHGQETETTRQNTERRPKKHVKTRRPKQHVKTRRGDQNNTHHQNVSLANAKDENDVDPLFYKQRFTYEESVLKGRK